MVKLNRIDQPLFAGDNTTADEEVAVFGSMKTSADYTMDLSELYSVAYTKGWQNAVVVGYAPFLEELNGVQYGFSYQIRYLQQQGIAEWNGTTDYYKGSIVKINTANGCQIYSSKIDNNISHIPNGTDTYWQLILDSNISYASQADLNTLQNNAVLKTGAQTIAGVKTLSSSPLVPTPSADDNSTKSANTAWVTSKVSEGVFPKVANRINILTSSSSNIKEYTAPSNGVMYFDQREGNVVTTIGVDGYTMLTMRGHSGSSHGQPSPCATVLVGKGQLVEWTVNTCAAVRFVPFG